MYKHIVNFEKSPQYHWFPFLLDMHLPLPTCHEAWVQALCHNSAWRKEANTLLHVELDTAAWFVKEPEQVTA